MPLQKTIDALYMDLAVRISQESKASRSKVGAVIVKDANIISFGWNGTPSGMDNSCETINADGSLTTKPEVSHAECNSIMKLVATGGTSPAGGTIYTTLSPCPECARLIKLSRISRVVYKDPYRLTAGLDFLKVLGVTVEQHNP